MRILVTGTQGQLARSLIERSGGEPGVEVIALGRPDLDLERPESIVSAINAVAPDAVINAAAYTAVDDAEGEPERAFRLNGDAAGELAAAARRLGAPIIHISTDYVFDGSGTKPYAEGAPTAPTNTYGRSKLEGEKRVQAENPDHLIVRTSWVYSPFGRNFVKTMVGVAARGGTARVVSDQRGNPSAAADLAEALLRVAASWKARPRLGLGEVYHLAGTGIASWHDVAQCVFEALARRHLPTARAEPIATADWPTRAARPAYSALDSRKFERDFGYCMPAWQSSVDAVVGRLAQGVPA